MTRLFVRWRFARAFAALLFVAPALGAQGDTIRFAAARDTIRAILESERIPSVSVAVGIGSEIVWEESFGFADRGRRALATPHTMYSLASISKPITATALMTFVQRGRVDLDKPINDYLGAAKLRAFDDDANAATVRRVLSHSAGLPLHYQFFYDGVVPPHSHDEAIAKYGIVGYTPGETYFYSNLGYGIIGRVVERLAGKSYEEAMRELVFEPLGMSNTTVSTGRGLGERAAVRYSDDLTPIAPYAFDHTGASGVWASAHDLVRFGMFHLGNATSGQSAILNADILLLMQQPFAPPPSPGASYGLGWATLESDRGHRRISHTGGMPGVSTVLNLYPGSEVAIVVLINKSSGAAASRIASAIAAEALSSYRASPAPPTVGAPSPSTLAGTWRGHVLVQGDTVPLSITIGANGTARAQLGTARETALNAASLAQTGWFTGRFVAPLRPADATPASEKDRITINVALRQRENRLTGWVSAVTSGQPSYGAVSYRAELTRSASRQLQNRLPLVGRDRLHRELGDAHERHRFE